MKHSRSPSSYCCTFLIVDNNTSFCLNEICLSQTGLRPCLCMCVYVCVCKCEKERARERERDVSLMSILYSAAASGVASDVQTHVLHQYINNSIN